MGTPPTTVVVVVVVVVVGKDDTENSEIDKSVMSRFLL